MTESPDTRILVFITASTRTKHRLAEDPWPRPLCLDIFTIGNVSEALVSDLDCERCIHYYTPPSYEVRLPDRRYASGYRVIHTGVETEEQAAVLAAEVQPSAAGEAYYVLQPIPESPEET